MTHQHARTRTAAWLLAAFLAGGAPVAQDANTPPRDGFAIADSLMTQLVERHPDPFHAHEREEFEERLGELLFEGEALSDAQFAVGLLRVLALVEDGHTTLTGWWQLFPRVPLRVAVFADGLFVVAAAPEHAELVGARITAIGETPTEEALERVAEVFAADNEWHRLGTLAYFLVMPAVLHAQRLVPGPERFDATFSLRDGTQRSVAIPTAAAPAAWSTLPAAEEALPFQRRASERLYAYEVRRDDRALHCRYDSCSEDPAQPFAAFVDEMMAAVDEHGLERFVLDLRNNGGGNSIIVSPLLTALAEHPELSRPGRVFVLIGRRTFSSAMMNAYQMRGRLGAVLVGEPTGGKPNSFGEIVRLPLEGTALQLQCSTRYFHAFRDSDPVAVFPDLEVSTSAAAFFAGEDPVLEAALTYEPER